MKILVCFASKGKSRDDIEYLRTSCARKASRACKSADEEIAIYDPFTLVTAPIDGQKDSLAFISDVVHMLLEIDVVYLAKGWSTDRYCKVIFNICQQYGVKYVSE